MFPVRRTGLAWFSLGRLQHIDIGRVCSHSTVQYSLHQSSVLTDSVGGPVAQHWVPVVLSRQVGQQLQPCSNSGYSNVSHGKLHRTKPFFVFQINTTSISPLCLYQRVTVQMIVDHFIDSFTVEDLISCQYQYCKAGKCSKDCKARQ